MFFNKKDYVRNGMNYKTISLREKKSANKMLENKNGNSNSGDGVCGWSQRNKNWGDNIVGIGRGLESNLIQMKLCKIDEKKEYRDNNNNNNNTFRIQNFFGLAWKKPIFVVGIGKIGSRFFSYDVSIETSKIKIQKAHNQ